MKFLVSFIAIFLCSCQPTRPTTIAVTDITETNLIGRLGIPILQNAIISGTISIPNTKGGDVFLRVDLVNEKKLEKSLTIEMASSKRAKDFYKEGESVLLVGHESVFISRGCGSLPQSDGMKKILEKYEIPKPKEELSIQTDWFSFEVRSSLVVVQTLQKKKP